MKNSIKSIHSAAVDILCYGCSLHDIVRITEYFHIQSIVFIYFRQKLWEHMFCSHNPDINKRSEFFFFLKITCVLHIIGYFVSSAESLFPRTSAMKF